MATGKKRRKAKVTPVIEHQELRGFRDGAGTFPNFSFIKYYWAGEGQRGWIASRIEKKLNPGSGLDGEPSDMEATKSELLVPAFAPDAYADLGLCLYSYDRSFSAAETNAYVQLTFSFPEAMNTHHCYEMVRSFVRAELVDGLHRNLAVLLILHKPQESGSLNDPHIHACVLLRRLNQLGWGPYDKSLPTDAGNRDIYEAWVAFKKRWTVEWPVDLHEMSM
jgi:hypothetical protein